MSTMNIPGFTAEHSLYRHRRHYRMAATALSADRSGILPQLRRRTPDDCIPGCICVSPINCPCCDSLGWPGPKGPKDDSVFV